MPSIIKAKSTENCWEINAISPSVSLLEQLQHHQVPVRSSCMGKGTCHQCRVRVEKGFAPISENDRKTFSQKELADGWRLSCSIKPKTSLEIFLPNTYLFKESIKIHRAPRGDWWIACDLGTTQVELSAVDSEGVWGEIKGLNRQISMGADVMTRLEFAQRHGVQPLQKRILNQIKNMLSALQNHPTYCHPGESDASHEIPTPSSTAGDDDNAGDPHAASRLGMTKTCHPGESRDPEIPTCVGMTNGMTKARIGMTKPRKIYIAGNSAVTSFIANLPIEQLAVSPYQPASLNSQTISTEDFDMETLPLIHSFVGGDLFAGIFKLWLDKKIGERSWILIDIGTNSEIIFWDGNRLFISSTPAGPAFEGSSISIGMRAEGGAIINPRYCDNKWVFETIGDDLPSGICGSALIELIAESIKNGIISKDGKVLKPEKLYLTTELCLIQDDIREFQLAKSAIKTGLDLVSSESSKRPECLYLAGAFGTHLKLEACLNIGLLPNIETITLGNLSLAGTIEWGKSDVATRKRFIDWLSGVQRPIELALREDFQQAFIENMRLGD